MKLNDEFQRLTSKASTISEIFLTQQCLGKPVLKSAIICLLESSIKVITFSITNYLFPVVQISYTAPICKVVSPGTVGKQYAKDFMIVKEAQDAAKMRCKWSERDRCQMIFLSGHKSL